MKMVVGIVALVVLLSLAVSGAVAQTALPPTPTNLEVVATTQDSITVAWGPAQPGPFYLISGDSRSAVVGWGVSQDSRSAITYTLTKNGNAIASGISMNSFRVTGLNKVKSFRTCVTAINAAGQSSPPMCATWTRP